MGDDALQKEGGDALWNSVTHALKPGAIRYVSIQLFLNLKQVFVINLTDFIPHLPPFSHISSVPF